MPDEPIQKRVTLEGVMRRLTSFLPEDRRMDTSVSEKAGELYLRIRSGEKRILIIKNGEDIGYIVKALRDEGLKVDVCESRMAEAALRKSESYGAIYNVVMSCSTIDPLEKAKSMSNAVKTIFLSGNSGGEIPRHAVDYLLALASEETIVGAVCDLLAQQTADYVSKTDYQVDCYNLLEIFDDVSELERTLSRRFNFEPKGEPQKFCQAEAQYPGAASGKLYTDLNAAVDAKKKRGTKVVVFVDNINVISPRDVRNLVNYTDGVICREVPNELSHLAIDLQSAGIPMISLSGVEVSCKEGSGRGPSRRKHWSFGKVGVYEKSDISIEGSSGRIYKGKCQVTASPVEKHHNGEELTPVEAKELAKYAKAREYARRILGGKLEMTINADTVEEIEAARKFGVDTIALVRSENNIKESDENLRTYCEFLISVMSDDREMREQAMEAFESMQSEAFYTILKKQCEGGKSRRTHIRLVDSPFVEFFDSEAVDETARRMGAKAQKGADELKRLLPATSEVRGVRLGKAYPIIYEAQVRAMVRACDRLKEEGLDPNLKIFVPYLTNADEMMFVSKMLEDKGVQAVEDKLGATIETSMALFRTALDMVASRVRYYNIGTNDLLTELGAGSRNPLRLVNGRYEIDAHTMSAIEDCVRNMYKRAHEMSERGEITEDPIEWLKMGIAGEMNPVKLDNFRRVITLTREDIDDPDAARTRSISDKMPIVQYISSGRAAQVPVIEYCAARIYAQHEQKRLKEVVEDNVEKIRMEIDARGKGPQDPST